MCDLTTKWILEKCPEFNVCTYIMVLRSTWNEEVLIPWSESLRRSERSGMLIDDPLQWGGAVLALPMRSSGERRTQSSEYGSSDAQKGAACS